MIVAGGSIIYGDAISEVMIRYMVMNNSTSRKKDSEVRTAQHEQQPKRRNKEGGHFKQEESRGALSQLIIDEVLIISHSTVLSEVTIKNWRIAHTSMINEDYGGVLKKQQPAANSMKTKRIISGERMSRGE